MNNPLALLTANAIPITKASRLLLTFWNSDNTAQQINIRWVAADENGNPINSYETFSAAAGGNPTTYAFTLTRGSLISLTISTQGTQCPRGALYTTATLIQGSVNSNEQKLIIASGYVSTANAVNYPLSSKEDSISGIGGTVLTTLNQVPGNATLAFAPTDQSRVHLIGGQIPVTLDVASTATDFLCTVSSNAQIILRNKARTAPTAGTTTVYFLWIGPNEMTPLAGDAVIYLPNHIDLSSLQIQFELVGGIGTDLLGDGFIAWNQLTDVSVP